MAREAGLAPDPGGCRSRCLGVSPVGENDKARALKEQAARSRDFRELSYVRGHWREDRPDPLSEPHEPAPDELGLLHSQVPGHRWNGWRRLTGDEDCYAACSCGWRSTETGDVSPMLVQVKDHLDAIRALRGWRRAPRTAPAPHRDGHEGDGSRHELLHERTREMYAAVESQQGRLSQALGQSADLLSASADQADRPVAVLEHAAARVAPDWVKTEASVRRAETLQHRAERARELRNGILAAEAALAAIAEEIAGIHLGLETGHQEAVDQIYGERLIQPSTAEPSSGKRTISDVADRGRTRSDPSMTSSTWSCSRGT